jgi:hypothetical protein
LNGLLDRYFPFQDDPKWQPVDEHARQIKGTYITASRVESGRLKINSLLEQIHVSVNHDGQLINRMATDDRGHAIRLRYLGNDLWQDETGQGRIMAVRDAQGQVNGLASMFGATMMVSVPWYENAHFALSILAISLLLSSLIVCSTLFRFLFSLRDRFWDKADRREYKTRNHLTKSERWAAFLWVPAVIFPLQMLRHIARQPLPPFAEIPVWSFVQNILIVFAICASIPGIVLAFRVLVQTKVPIHMRLLHFGIGVSFLSLTWFSLHWHLLGPISRY